MFENLMIECSSFPLSCVNVKFRVFFFFDTYDLKFEGCSNFYGLTLHERTQPLFNVKFRVWGALKVRTI
jgi:hypothetical protein